MIGVIEIGNYKYICAQRSKQPWNRNYNTDIIIRYTYLESIVWVIG